MAVKALTAAGTALLFLALCAPMTSAVPVEERELGRWVPSAGFVLSLSADRVEGHLNTSEVIGPQFSNPGTPVSDPQLLPGTPATARTTMMTPSFGGSFELMTPALRSIAGRPRAFGRVDISFAFGPVYQIPSVGDPGPFRKSRSAGAGFGESQILGQGGWTRATIDPLVVMAGGGIAFTIDAWGAALRLKPSAEYMRQEVEVTGLARRVIQQAPSHTSIDQFRKVTLYAEGTQVYHFLGPGIEIDVDAARAGPFVLAPYIGLKAWAILDNSKVVLEDSNEWAETAVFTFLPNKWAFGGSIGMRFRWAPE